MITYVDSDYPRVLAIDAVGFHRATNTGILKSNLFHGWPAGSLAQIIVGTDRPDFSVCNRYWRITREDRLWGRKGREIADCADRPNELKIGTKAVPNRLRKQGLVDQVFQLAGYVPWALPMAISGELREWLGRFHPQVIFTLGASLGVFAIIRRVSDEFGIPVVPLITDDWIHWMYRRGAVDAILRRNLAYAFEDILQRSGVRLTVSEAMAEEYSRRYCIEFLPCMDLIDLDSWSYRPYKPRNGTLILRFVGYLEPDRWRSLILLREVVQELREEGRDVRFDIYTFPAEIEKFGSLLHAPPAVEVRNAVPFDHVPSLLSEADVLVHAEAFGLAEEALIALSFSTKIPQYLAAGRAILGLGPTSAASMQYIGRWSTGLIVGEESKRKLKDALFSLLGDSNLRSLMAANAREVAQMNHGAARGRERFRTLLMEGAQAKDGAPTASLAAHTM